jgi:formiminotetrahydrofolate cyclodeaminase
LASSRRLLDLGLEEFLAAVPERTSAPGAGAAAAVAAALAAGLTAMAGRFAPEGWERRDEIVARADELRALVEPLADADAEAYGAYLADRSAESAERIVAVPLEIARAAAETAELASAVAAGGNPNLRGDAAAGADLAAAAASIAARLVTINAGGADERARETWRLAERAAKTAADVSVSDMF